MLIVLVIIVGVAIFIVTNGLKKDEVKVFISKKGGEVFTIDLLPFANTFIDNRRVSYYSVVYYDKHKNIRQCKLRVGPYTGIIVVNDSAKKNTIQDIKTYKEEVVKKEFVKYHYKCTQGEIIIDQELYSPNVGESVFLNDKMAPDGKYKIGFLNHIMVLNGVLHKTTMS
jgi:hypothetical protein